MTNRRLATIALLAALVPAAALAADAKPIAVAKLDRSTPVDFEKEVLPVLNASCLACHNKTKPKAGLVLETPADILKGGDSGPAVVAGKPDESLLIKSAAHSAPDDVSVMPPAGNKVNAPNLTSEQLGLVALWVTQGAKGEVKAPAPLAWRPVAETVKPVLAVAVAPDGSFAAAGRGTGIDVYKLPDGKQATKLTDPALKSAAHKDLVQSVAISPDGKMVASGAYREVKLWARDGDGWKLDYTIGTGGADSPLADRVNALDFSRDGKRLAIGGGVPSRTGQIAIWSVEGKKIERTIDDAHSDSVLSLQFSADGKRLVTGSADKFVRLIDLETGKAVKSFEGHTHHVLGVSIRADGKAIASAGADNAVRFWDVETGERRKPSPASEKEATAVRYLGETDQVVITSGDAKVRVVKDTVAEGKALSGAADFVYCAAASKTGDVIAAGGQDGVVRVWDAKGKMVAELK